MGLGRFVEEKNLFDVYFFGGKHGGVGGKKDQDISPRWRNFPLRYLPNFPPIFTGDKKNHEISLTLIYTLPATVSRPKRREKETNVRMWLPSCDKKTLL